MAACKSETKISSSQVLSEVNEIVFARSSHVDIFGHGERWK